MREWFRLEIAAAAEAAAAEAARSHFAELHEGHSASPPATPEAYLDQYLNNFHLGRLRAYYDIVRPVIGPADHLLSIGSGRFAIEMALARDTGCRILCTEVETPPWLDEARALFPDLCYADLDALAGPAPGRFDAVISSSLIYLFDDQRLSDFFRTAAEALKPGGRLLLDLAGAPDNAAAALFHDIWLPCEFRLLALAQTLATGRRHVVRRRFHGYRRTTAEVAAIARRHGLALEDERCGGFAIDYYRSRVLGGVARRWPAFLGLLERVGRWAPYLRVACLRRAP
jgi:SAM-dependent methyltransferase